MPLPEPLAGLVRDHRVVEEVITAARKAVAAATAESAGQEVVAAALEQARDLDAFASVDLTLHITKEEQILFPAVRERAGEEMGVIIDDMLAQHDEIRDGKARVRLLLEALDAGHAEIEAGSASLAAGLKAAEGERSPSAFAGLHATIRTLDSLLQGHFLDEEDNVFEVVVDWFSPEVLSVLAARMSALESDYA